jgi:hypothetical protein
MFQKSVAALLLSLAALGFASASGHHMVKRGPTPPPNPPSPALHGTIKGTYDHPIGVDGPIVYLVQGSGTVAPLGKATAKGSVVVKGFGPGAGNNGVSLTLSDGKGSVTLSLLAPGAQYPASFQYKVSNATGAFAGLKGKTGTAQFTPTATGLTSGTFTLTFP